MFDRPPGLVDNKSLGCFNRNDFSLYDSMDEEVHFSRHPTLKPGSVVCSTQTTFYNVHPTEWEEQDLSGQLNGSSETTQSASESKLHDDAQLEQVKSSRLLSTIGTKLKRGSNFISAPTMVGSYLLGISIRSWVQFFDTSRMLKAPINTHQLTRRVISNLDYFRGNYLCVAFILIVYCILTSPLLLLAIIAYLVGLYYVTARSASGRPLHLGSFQPNLQQQYYTLTLISIPLLWVAGAPGAVFWIIGASFVIVGLHASMYNSERISDAITANNTCLSVTPSVSTNNFVPTAAVQYYKHYQSNHYLPVATPQPQLQDSNSQTKQVPSWTLFGYLSRHTTKPQLKLDIPGNLPHKVPEVRIISQDYAGLGRVYEV